VIIIPGRIVSGLGAASKTITMQMPHFVQSHPELGKCLQRTINVVLQCQLEIISPSFLIGPIKWHPNGPAELFGFRSIIFELPEHRLQTDAWLYMPYLSPHRANPFHVEVLAPELQIEGINGCAIHIEGGGKFVA
jgi:hypothetical protein